VRPNVASRGLSRECHLPFFILLHFLEFTFNNNGLVDHVLLLNSIKSIFGLHGVLGL
jgi:hypothetical protein